MAHIVDGVLATPVLVGGGVLAAAGIAAGLRAIDRDAVPRVGVVGAALFVAALIHVPVGPASSHLMLIGLAGLLLGWAAVPAIFIAMLLQAVFFGFGGVTVLGVNTVIQAVPAVMCFYLLGRPGRTVGGVARGATAGALGVMLTASGVAAALAVSGEAFMPAAKLVLAAHIPVAVVEAIVTGAVVALLVRVRPEAFAAATIAAPARDG